MLSRSMALKTYIIMKKSLTEERLQKVVKLQKEVKSLKRESVLPENSERRKEALSDLIIKEMELRNATIRLRASIDIDIEVDEILKSKYK